MAPYPNWLRNSLLAGWALALPALAVEVPAGAQLQVRLKTKIASNTSKPDDPVETTVIAPVMVNGALAIPAGVTLGGVVTGAGAATDPAVRAMLALDFRELEMGGQRIRVHTLLTAVENARESVNDKGEIQGILANETLSARMDSGIGKVAEKYSGFGGFLSAAKNAVFKETEGDISYDAGVEMDLKLTAAVTLTGPPPPGPDAALQPVADRRALIDLANRQPFQSRAQNPPKPSDVTTLMFIGSQEQVQGAFAGAGWSQASKLGEKSKLETLRAIAEDRGYSEAPVSILYLDGRRPEMVFEKLNNTFSKRHHLRIWLRPDRYQGEPVWVSAATHDTGIDFSAKDRTFIHKIDSQIDMERSKVVNDLLLTGKVRSLLLVDRPNVPQHGQNATGDNLTTDAKMAVLILQWGSQSWLPPCGADLQVCAGPPGPALRVTESAISEHEQADVDVGRPCWSPAPRITQHAQNGKTSGINLSAAVDQSLSRLDSHPVYDFFTADLCVVYWPPVNLVPIPGTS